MMYGIVQQGILCQDNCLMRKYRYEIYGGIKMGNTRMGARERIEYLLDAHSFVELAGYVSARNTDYNLGAKKVKGDGVITGYGVLNDRMVYVYSQDASALGGSVGEMHAKKIASLYDLAMKTGAPIIGLLDCAGLRLQEATDALHAFGTIFYKQTQASGKIPQIAAVFGMCGGGSAVMSSLADFTLMEKEHGRLFVNSPNTFAGNTEEQLNTASAQYQAAKTENVDIVCDSEEELLSAVKKLVDFLPSDYEAEDAAPDCDDDLNRIIPELNDSEYDARFILSSISDENIFMELKKDFGTDMVTAFIALDGETVGAVANQPVDGESRLSYKGLRKAARFIKFCDAFSIPILTVTNVEGLKADTHEERRQAEALAAFTAALAQSTVARINLIAGTAYGTAAVVMNSKAIGADFVLAWPDARIGMMDAGQAVRIMYGEELQEMEDQAAFLTMKTAEYKELQSSALSAAYRGYVDDIIEPDATRKRLIAAYDMLYGKTEQPAAKKHPAI